MFVRKLRVNIFHFVGFTECMMLNISRVVFNFHILNEFWLAWHVCTHVCDCVCVWLCVCECVCDCVCVCDEMSVSLHLCKRSGRHKQSIIIIIKVHQEAQKHASITYPLSPTTNFSAAWNCHFASSLVVLSSSCCLTFSSVPSTTYPLSLTLL